MFTLQNIPIHAAFSNPSLFTIIAVTFVVNFCSISIWQLSNWIAYACIFDILTVVFSPKSNISIFLEVHRLQAQRVILVRDSNYRSVFLATDGRTLRTTVGVKRERERCVEKLNRMQGSTLNKLSLDTDVVVSCAAGRGRVWLSCSARLNLTHTLACSFRPVFCAVIIA